MIAYSYSEINGQYIGFEDADESPLEPGVFHLPAYSTAVEPPAEQNGFIRVWDGNSWEQVAIPTAPEPNLEAEARLHRDQLLFACDYTQLDDVPISNRGAWVTYRQALRDVPQQAGFPADITWPVPPNYIKS